MNLLDTFKAVSAINQANEFVKNHEDMINRVKSLVKNVQNAISFLEAKKDIISKSNEIVFCGYGEPLIKIDEVVEISKYLKENWLDFFNLKKSEKIN